MLVKNQAAANIGALNAAVAATIEDADTFTIAVSGTFSGTITFEGTPDNTNWYTLALVKSDTADRKSGTGTTTTTGLWFHENYGLLQVRARMSTYGSGAATIKINTARQGI